MFQGRKFDEAAVFIKRSLDYLDRSEKKEIQADYLKECLDLDKGIFWHIKNNELIIPEKLSQYRINERIEPKS